MRLKFDNGMEISIQQGEGYYSDYNETCEVAVFYPNGDWYDLDGLGNETSVLGRRTATELAVLMTEIAALSFGR